MTRSGEKHLRLNRSPSSIEIASSQIERHLAFRDYMLAYPEDAQKYSELKRELARKYPQSIDRYMDGKDEFIKEMDKKAAQWRTLKSLVSKGLNLKKDDSIL